jgi:hypothetical protein
MLLNLFRLITLYHLLKIIFPLVNPSSGTNFKSLIHFWYIWNCDWLSALDDRNFLLCLLFTFQFDEIVAEIEMPFYIVLTLFHILRHID